MKSINNILILKITIFLILLTLFSCENENDEKVKEFRYIVKENLGSKLIIPSDLQIYKPFSNYLQDSLEMSNSKFKVYSIINASCGTCIDNMKRWEEFSSNLLKSEVVVILIFKSDDNFELLKYACEKGIIREFPYPFFLDPNNMFMQQNKFMKRNKHFETCLTDANNRIILLGNPLYNENIKELYIKQIKGE